MWNVFVFLIAIGITSFYIVKFLEETWLLEPQKRRLQERFEVWWRAFAGTDAKKLALSLASKISDLVDEYFGRRLFSKRAFVRSFVISTGLLLSSLALTGLLNGRIVGVSPWNAYSETAEALKNIPQPQARTLQTPPDKRSQEIAKKLSEIAAKYGTSGWKIAYSVAFIMSLILLNSLLFFLALVFSRVTLSEIIAARKVFFYPCTPLHKYDGICTNLDCRLVTDFISIYANALDGCPGSILDVQSFNLLVRLDFGHRKSNCFGVCRRSRESCSPDRPSALCILNLRNRNHRHRSVFP